ncbi:MAG: thioesterase [Thermoanaerobaculia bacterium]|nr:thioesterase [Thermoanaerobaculia bacterium]
MTGSEPVAVQTHTAIARDLSGTPVAVSDGWARLRLVTTQVMAADGRGLVHGGFVFSLADHAAMVAVNHPLVVLGSADVKFLRPVRVGQELFAEARTKEVVGKKYVVSVTVVAETAAEPPVFEGEFVCFVPDRPVFDRST